MKPFLGVDRTNDKKNEEMNGIELAVAKTPAATVDALNNAGNAILETQKKANLPWYLRVLRWILLFAGFLCIRLGLEGVGDIATFAVIGGGSFIGSWLITRYGGKRAEKIMSTDEATVNSRNLDELAASIYRDFGVPEAAPEIDILSFAYKMKNGEMKIVSGATSLTPYLNYNYRMFIKDENLVVADRECKFELPLSMIRSLTQEKCRVTIPIWTKDEECNSEKYKEYKLTEDNNGLVSMKYRLKLEFYANGEEWAMFLPYYEKATIEMLTRMTAVEVEK